MDFEAIQAVGFIEDKNPDGVLQDVGEQFVNFIAPLLPGTENEIPAEGKLGSRDWKPYNMYRERIPPGLIFWNRRVLFDASTITKSNSTFL
jgi:hypothetical protein